MPATKSNGGTPAEGKREQRERIAAGGPPPPVRGVPARARGCRVLDGAAETAVAQGVSFTFDDGPDPVWTARVHSELERLDVRASFFAIGARALLHPETLKASVDAGHEIQLHCHRHIRHDRLTEAQLRLDVERALEALSKAGVTAALWRAPWGLTTPASERVARSFGLQLHHWSIDTHDWRGDAPETMLDAAAAGLAAGGSVLMHDAIGPGSRRSGCENTIALLEGLTLTCRELGLEPEPVPAMLPAAAR